MNAITQAGLRAAKADKFEKILDEARDAARLAVAEASKKFPEMAGACGFAWVRIDGTEGLARHCRKMRNSEVASDPRFRNEYNRRYGNKGYPNGWQFWNPGDHMGQRVDIKEAGAAAFRDVLANYGIRADSGSRLD